MFLSGLELRILSAALFVASSGPIPKALRNMARETRRILGCFSDRLEEAIERTDEDAGTERASCRVDVIRNRLGVTCDLQTSEREFTLVSEVLAVCADEIEAGGDINPVSGIGKYGGKAEHFRALHKRMVEEQFMCDTSCLQ